MLAGVAIADKRVVALVPGMIDSGAPIIYAKYL
jgi:hypothetical protein